ncbi:MAG: hypothetical protein GX575_20325, partial [Candidatus Anammoximicrobium sp.]|nr:hypothetical protein [Candidatus Anammoximicrobium sp.]
MSRLSTDSSRRARSHSKQKTCKARRTRDKRRTLMLEPLESRQMLSVAFLDSEDNDALGSAQVVTHPGLAGVVDSQLAAGAVQSGDDDAFQFQAAVDGDLKFQVQRSSGTTDITAGLYDASDTLITSQTLTAAAPTWSYTISGVDPADAYKVLLSGDATYSLRIWNPDRADDAGANNNMPLTATDLGSFGAIAPADLQDYTVTRPDRDYFKFNMPAHSPGRLDVTVTMPTSTGAAPTNLGVRVRDANGRVLAASNSTGNVDTATFNAPDSTSPTQFYVEVYSDSVGQVNQYDLSITRPGSKVSGYKFNDFNGDGFQDIG